MYSGGCYKISPKAVSPTDLKGQVGTKVTSMYAHRGGLPGRFQTGWCPFILKHSELSFWLLHHSMRDLSSLTRD